MITKKAGRVAQVVEHLLSKHQAFSSNPSPTKKKKKKPKNRTTMSSSNTSPGHMSEGTEVSIHETHWHTHVYWSTIHNGIISFAEKWASGNDHVKQNK
jgi:hypothetical protein